MDRAGEHVVAAEVREGSEGRWQGLCLNSRTDAGRLQGFEQGHVADLQPPGCSVERRRREARVEAGRSGKRLQRQ